MKYSAQHIKRTIARYWKQIKAKHLSAMPTQHCGKCSKKAKLGAMWRKYRAKHSGLGQIPADYKKALDPEMNKMKVKHGKLPQIILRVQHQQGGIGMRKYAELIVPFLKEGRYTAVNKKQYFYPWEVIKRDALSYKGKEFYVNHDEINGKEMGIIADVFEGELDGEDWIFAKVWVPEVSFTQDFLDRVQNGLIKEVSSTHELVFDPNDPTATVKQIEGEALSTVRRGEVEGARILSIRRNLEGPILKKEKRAKLGKEWSRRRLNA